MPTFLRLFCLMLFPICCFSQIEEKTFEGIALNQRGTLAYREKHIQRYNDSKIELSRVEFYDEKDALIAYAEYQYEQSSYMPNYRLVNFRRNKEERVRVSDQNAIAIAVRKMPKEAFLTRTLHAQEPQVIGEGLYFFIQDQFAKLKAKEEVRVHLLFASRYQIHPLHIVPIRLVDDKQGKRLVCHLRYTHFLARLFGGQAVLIFDEATKRLLSYEGLSPLRDAQGNLQRVSISYSY